MVYEDLNLVKKNLKIKWYRSPVDIKKLRELSDFMTSFNIQFLENIKICHINLPILYIK